MNPSHPHPDPHAAADAAFARYFRAHLPAQWPAAPIPVDAAPALPARGGAWRTRMTLGAGVAAMLALGFALSYGPAANTAPKSGDAIRNPTANGQGLHKHMPKDDKIEK